MIKQFPTPEAYAAAGQPASESRVAQITQDNNIKLDGVNVLLEKPVDVCATFIDSNGAPMYVHWNTIRKNLLPASWTHIGFSFWYDGKHYKTIEKGFGTEKWLSVWQFSITAISAGTIKFWLKCKGDYATFIPVEVTLSDSSNGYINATSVSEINAVLETIGNTGNVGYDKHGYWAYLSDVSDNKVDSDGVKIVVQCDLCEDYRQYQCADSTHALVGCTMALSVWGDMPASSALFRATGKSTTNGNMNLERSIIYRSTNGVTPSANEPVDTLDLVTLEAFNTSSYCAELRAAYGDYQTYMKANKVMWPHPKKYGLFGLMDADAMTAKYGNVKAAKKDGTEVWKFPALHYGTTVGFGTGKFAAGRWHLSDVDDGMQYMDDDTLAKLAVAQKAMGTTVLTNNVYRWFARRLNANHAWGFGGTNGILSNYNVNGAYRCQAVTLSEID